MAEAFYPGGEEPPDDIIHVTCTGYEAPSAVQKLAVRRGWQDRVGITHAYHMGCYASMPAVRMATGYLALRSRAAANARRPPRRHRACGDLHPAPGPDPAPSRAVGGAKPLRRRAYPLQRRRRPRRRPGPGLPGSREDFGARLPGGHGLDSGRSRHAHDPGARGARAHRRIPQGIPAAHCSPPPASDPAEALGRGALRRASRRPPHHRPGGRPAGAGPRPGRSQPRGAPRLRQHVLGHPAAYLGPPGRRSRRRRRAP